MKSEPRHVYVVSWDTANTDLSYFVGHPDQVLDGVAAADIFTGDIINAATYSQSLNPIRANASIGAITFTFMDTDGGLSSLLNSKLLAGDGLRAKRVQHWIGERGAEWSGGYDLIQTHQINDSIKITNDGLGYQFTARDIQRSELEDIFDPKKTNLTASVSKTAITVNVNSTTGIDLIQHGPSYSDAPNENVLYFKIKDEIVRGTSKTSATFTVDNSASTLNGAVAKGASSIVVTSASSFESSGIGYIDDGAGTITEIKWTGKSSNTLTGVTGVINAHSSGDIIVNSKGRGALGTVAAAYSVDVSQPVSSRTKVTEHIYYEMPAMKLAYAILTGTLYGSANTIPAHHQLGIDSAWISTSQLTQFTDDLWDPADDTKGVIFRFSGLKKTNAKKFVEEELNFWCGVFNPILPTGELGLKRMTGVISDAAHTGIWNEDNVISIRNVRFDLNDIHNRVDIDWNFDPISGDYTRPISLDDTDSQVANGVSKTLSLKSKGLHGSIHTDAILANMFNLWRDRHAGPPFKASVTLDYAERGTKVGDIKRLQLDHIPEFTDQDGNYSSLDLAVEIQRISVNDKAGTVTAEVFGSTRKAGPLALGNDASPLLDAWFTGQGSDISGATTGTLSGGGTIWTIDTNSSITGADDLGSATATSDNDTGIFYWDGDLVVAAGVTLDISKNVELRVNGHFTNNGTINGKGQGLTGGTTGQAGAIGNTQAGGGLDGGTWWECTKSSLVEGVEPVAPHYIMRNNAGASLSGTPTNLQGSSGGKGGDVNLLGAPVQSGSSGGDGGAGLAIYCKGASGGVSASVDLSGNDGSAGVLVSASTPPVYAGSGAGGSAGILAIFLVGNTVTETFSDDLIANNGATPIVGNQFPSDQVAIGEAINYSPGYSFYTGIGAQDVSRANLLVDWVPDNLTPTADPAEIADTPTAISFTENSNIPQTPAENLATIDITVTPPSDTSYSHSMIAYKLASDSDAQFQRLPYPAKNETSVVLAMDGAEYTFRAYPVNLDGIESPDFAEKNLTVSSSFGGVTLATGNYIETSSTVGEGTNGEGIKYNVSGGLIGYDTTGVAKFTLDPSNGRMTAIEMILSSSTTGQRIEINPSNDNEIHFYGDRGDGTVEELATIGISSIGSDFVIGNFGNNNSGNSRLAVRAESYSGMAIAAASTSGIAINAFSLDGNAVNAETNGVAGRSAVKGDGGLYGYGVFGDSAYIGVKAQGFVAPIMLNPSTSASAPTSTAPKGSLWVTSAGVLYINTDGATTWEKVGAQ